MSREFEAWTRERGLAGTLDIEDNAEKAGPLTTGSMYAASGLAKEAGELLQLAHKAYFTGEGYTKDEVLGELADVLFNFHQLLFMNGITMREVELYMMDVKGKDW
jgi:NTP pyrophosphatase (non-canonical NTP hydrolase)